MMYKLLNEDGLYRTIDTLEIKNLMECNIAYTPDGINVGWDEFSTIEEAMSFYNIERVPEVIYDPVVDEKEKELNNLYDEVLKLKGF